MVNDKKVYGNKRYEIGDMVRGSTFLIGTGCVMSKQNFCYLDDFNGNLMHVARIDGYKRMQPA